MKTRRNIVIAAISVSLLCVGGCSTSSGSAKTTAATGSSDAMSPEKVLSHEDVAGKAPAAVYQAPIAKVREAGIRALTFVGCKMKIDEPYHLRGRRPNKVGLFVGSGGESVEIFLYPKSENETQVWVDTDLSFVGIAGQQSWNDQVVGQMNSILKQANK